MKYLIAFLIVTNTVFCFSYTLFNTNRRHVGIKDLEYFIPNSASEFSPKNYNMILTNWKKIQAGNNVPNSENADYLWIKLENISSNVAFNTLYISQFLNSYEIFVNSKLIASRTSHTEFAEYLNHVRQNLIDLPNIKNDDKIFIKIYNRGKKDIFIPNITIGESAEIIKFIIKENLLNSIIVIFVIISALFTLLFFIILERRKIIFGLFIFLISIGLWISMNNVIVQIVFNSPIYLFYFNFFSFQLTGIAFFYILSEIVETNYHKIISVIWRLKLLVLIVSLILISAQPEIIKIAKQSIFFINIIFLLIGLVTVFFNLKTVKISRKVLMFGMIFIMIATLIQTLVTFLNIDDTLNTAIIDLGTFIFIASIIWLGILNYIESKKEKEKIKEIEFEAIKNENEARSQFSTKLIESQENERNRIALELHDSIGQKLLLIKNQVLSRLKNLNSGDDKEILEKISNLSDETITEIRNITYNLRPQYLDQLGLNIAIESIAEKITELSSIEIIEEIDESINELIPKNNQINFFRIIQESLNNIVKHSNADKVFLRIRVEENSIFLEIRDNGIGFKDYDNKEGTGLTSMKERARMLNSSLKIFSNESGTKITMNYPIEFFED